MKRLTVCIALMVVVGGLTTDLSAQKKNQKLARVCGNPEAACKGRSSYQPYDLPVEWKTNSVIGESEPFYAIILKSAKSDGNNCGNVYSNQEILLIQNGFPMNKVFAYKCGEAGENYYTGVDGNFVFIAVFAGRTLAEANKFLKLVHEFDDYKTVKLRKMRVGVNGT